VATGKAEAEAAERILKLHARRQIQPKKLGGDKGYDKRYDKRGFVAILRGWKITPHMGQNTEKRGGSGIDGRTIRHAGYSLSQRIWKPVEEIYGWVKPVGGFRKTRFKGVRRTQLAAWFVGPAYNLLPMAKLMLQKAMGWGGKGAIDPFPSWNHSRVTNINPFLNWNILNSAHIFKKQRFFRNPSIKYLKKLKKLDKKRAIIYYESVLENCWLWNIFFIFNSLSLELWGK